MSSRGSELTATDLEKAERLRNIRTQNDLELHANKNYMLTLQNAFEQNSSRVSSNVGLAKAKWTHFEPLPQGLAKLQDVFPVLESQLGSLCQVLETTMTTCNSELAEMLNETCLQLENQLQSSVRDYESNSSGRSETVLAELKGSLNSFLSEMTMAISRSETNYDLTKQAVKSSVRWEIRFNIFFMSTFERKFLFDAVFVITYKYLMCCSLQKYNVFIN